MTKHKANYYLNLFILFFKIRSFHRQDFKLDLPLLSRGPTLYTSRELRKDLGSNLQLFSCKRSYCRHLIAATIYRLHQNFHYNTQVSESCRWYPVLTICSRVSGGFRKQQSWTMLKNTDFHQVGWNFPVLVSV